MIGLFQPIPNKFISFIHSYLRRRATNQVTNQDYYPDFGAASSSMYTARVHFGVSVIYEHLVEMSKTVFVFQNV
jgi:hypothetical protein